MLFDTLNPKRALAVALVLALAAALGACESNPSEPEAPGSGGSTTIGAAGGTVVSADNSVTLTIPAGGLTSATEVSITKVDRSTLGSDLAAVSVGPLYRLEPDGLALAAPATLEIDVTAEFAATNKIEITNPAAVLAAIGAQASELLDNQWQNVDLASGARVLVGELQFLSDVIVLFDDQVYVDAIVPDEVIEGEQFRVLIGATYEPSAADSPVLHYDESPSPLVYLSEQGQEVAQVVGGGDSRDWNMSAVDYVCTGAAAKNGQAEYIATIVMPGYAFGSGQEIGLLIPTTPLHFQFIAAIDCITPEEPEVEEIVPPVARLHQGRSPWDEDSDDKAKREAAPDFCKGIPREECLIATGRGVKIIDARTNTVVNQLLDIGLEYKASINITPPPGVDGPDAWDYVITYGPHGYASSGAINGNFGLSLTAGGSFTDAVPFDGYADSGGATIVVYSSNFVWVTVYNPDGTLGGEPTVMFAGSGAQGKVISAFARRDPATQKAGGQMLSVTDQGEILYIDRAVSQVPAIVAQAGSGSRNLRCVDEVCAVANFDSDDLSILRWNPDGSVEEIATVPVGDGPSGVDMLALDNGNVLIASNGYNDGTYSVTEVSADGSLVRTETLDVPGECSEATFATLRSGTRLQVVVTCQDSNRLVLVDAQ